VSYRIVKLLFSFGMERIFQEPRLFRIFSNTSSPGIVATLPPLLSIMHQFVFGLDGGFVAATSISSGAFLSGIYSTKQ
jgi:hypothetical protein